MKPMLASAATSDSLRFPMLVSPKLDGVRCLIINGKAMSRSLKPIPNAYVQRLFGQKVLNGLDGELIVGPPNHKDAYRTTSSGVMTRLGEPNVTFWVFDDFTVKGPFGSRLAKARKRVLSVGSGRPIEIVEHYIVRDADKLFEMEKDYLEDGYEGLMLRAIDGPYKEGRSTESEGWLLKLKRFVDGEAVIVGVQQFMHNANEAKRNKLGQLERSSHKANKVALPMVGALHVKDVKTGAAFDIGSGFTEAERKQLWRERKVIGGQVVKYKFQPTGVKDKPRFPVFMGMRDLRDM